MNSRNKRDNMHSFTTERLLIRPLAETDREFYCQLYTDAKVMRSIGKPMTASAASKAFSRSLKALSREKKSVLTWVIITKETNNIVGIQALSWQKSLHEEIQEISNKIKIKLENSAINQAEIGIMLATKANGQLYPEEAMGALMEYAFNYLFIDRINAFYASKNLATKRFVKKLGFHYDAAQQPKNTNDSYQYFENIQWNSKLIRQTFLKHKF